jgi:hypothetical protein
MYASIVLTAMTTAKTAAHFAFATLARQIARPVESMLWGRAAGRCEFRGCNRPLYKSSVTQESVNIAEKAHIWGFSAGGPRAPKSRTEALNDIGNLMLVCHDCHCKIDKNKDSYPVKLLQAMKAEHEDRVRLVTGIALDRSSRVVVYGAAIGQENSPLDKGRVHAAMVPARFPMSEEPIKLSMAWSGRDRTAEYWAVESENLRREFERQVRPRLDSERCHWSVFGLAPMPLLVLLGSLFTDKTEVEVYQLHREPAPGWEWSEHAAASPFELRVRENRTAPPVFAISLSARINPDRIRQAAGTDVAIWELTHANPHNDFLKTRAQLSSFREAARDAIAKIAERHGVATPLKIFPAMPVAAAVELGRIRMPKANMPWELFDQQGDQGFVPAIVIR